MPSPLRRHFLRAAALRRLAGRTERESPIDAGFDRCEAAGGQPKSLAPHRILVAAAIKN
jgi:hypothetical protein